MRWMLFLSCLLGLSSVALGAAGGHLFAGLWTPESARRFEAALRYHQLYAVLLFAACAFGAGRAEGRLYQAGVAAIAVGTVLFCASLYLSLMPDLTAAARLTPFGGTAIMAGWTMIGVWALKAAMKKAA